MMIRINGSARHDPNSIQSPFWPISPRTKISFPVHIITKTNCSRDQRINKSPFEWWSHFRGWVHSMVDHNGQWLERQASAPHVAQTFGSQRKQGIRCSEQANALVSWTNFEEKWITIVNMEPLDIDIDDVILQFGNLLEFAQVDYCDRWREKRMTN